MAKDEFDVIILGAGVAGLSAARELSAAGLKLAIVEARDRIGGRIFTHRDPLSPVPIELGAEFIHGEPPQLLDAVRAAGLTFVEVTGEHLCARSGYIDHCGQWMEKVEGVLESMRSHQGADRSFQSFIETSEGDQEAKAGAVSFVEGFNAADKHRVGVQSLLRQQKAEDAINGEKAYRIVAGYHSVSQFLMMGIPAPPSILRVNSVVHEIQWQPGRIRFSVTSRMGKDLDPFVARRAIITLPLGVLQTGSVRFQPEPPAFRELVNRLAMGKVVRVTLRFRERFWDTRRELKDMSFLHSSDQWFPTWWSTLPVIAPILTAWIAGPNADRFDGRDECFIVQRALETLAKLLGMDAGAIANQLEAWYTHNWQADPFAMGAYSYVPVGSLDAVEQLTRPIEKTLYFAGEATDTQGHWGTVHGAMATGVRAARQILADR